MSAYFEMVTGLLNVLQAELEADRARLKRVEGTICAMRSLSDTNANTEEYKAKVCFTPNDGHDISCCSLLQSPS